MNEKRIQFGNEGEPLVPGKTENLSSSLHSEGDAAKPDATLGRQEDDKARPAERDRFDRREEELDKGGER